MTSEFFDSITPVVPLLKLPDNWVSQEVTYKGHHMVLFRYDPLGARYERAMKVLEDLRDGKGTSTVSKLR